MNFCVFHREYAADGTHTDSGHISVTAHNAQEAIDKRDRALFAALVRRWPIDERSRLREYRRLKPTHAQVIEEADKVGELSDLYA